MADGNTPMPESYSRAERILHAIYDEPEARTATSEEHNVNPSVAIDMTTATPEETSQTRAAASNPISTTSAPGSMSTPKPSANIFVARTCLYDDEVTTMKKVELLSSKDVDVFHRMMSHSLSDQTLQDRVRLLIKTSLYITSNFALVGVDSPLTEFGSLYNEPFSHPTNTGGGKLNLLLRTLTLIPSAKRKIGIVIQAGKPMTMLQKHLHHRLIRHRSVDDEIPPESVTGGDPSMLLECILVPSGPEGRHCIVPACDVVFVFDHTANINEPQVAGMRQSETEHNKFCPCIRLVSANMLEERFASISPQPSTVDSISVNQMRVLLSDGWASSQGHLSSQDLDWATSQALAKWILEGCNPDTLPLPAGEYANDTILGSRPAALSHSTSSTTTQMPSPANPSHPLPPTTQTILSTNGNNDFQRQMESLRQKVETLMQEKGELQSNAERQTKEIKKQEKARKLVQEQLDFLQSQYATARDAAATSSSEARDLSSQVKRLQDALSEGLKQKDTFLEQYRQDHQRAVKEHKAQLEILMEQNRRTDDMIRHRAATARTCQHCDPIYDANVAYHCEWGIDDQTCGESFSSKQALQGHLYISHIRPDL